MRRLLAMVVLAAALASCGPRPEPGPDSPDLEAQDVARAFAAAVLDRADREEAMRWADPSAALDVRSQAGFLVGEREAKYAVGRAARGDDGAWTAAVRIDRLRVGEWEYRGQMRLDLGPDGRRVRDSVLLLERSDGVGLAL